MVVSEDLRLCAAWQDGAYTNTLPVMYVEYEWYDTATLE